MTTSTAAATTTTNRSLYYPAMSSQSDHLFQDEQIQRYDANTIRNRYGDDWKRLVSNVREVTQPDGSIVKEYIIEDPTLLGQMQTSSRPMDSTSSTTVSDDEQQSQHQYNSYASQPVGSKNKFAEIKAKFEQKHGTNVMGSPSTSSATTSGSSTRPNSHQLSDQLYAKHRRSSNESLPSTRPNGDHESLHSSHQSLARSTASHGYDRSQSIGSEKSKGSSMRRLNSADEADEEVRRIHRQGEERRRYKQELSPISSTNEIPDQTRVQYEVVDEDGNPLAIDGIQNLIQMSGVRAREVPQPDGTIIKEYVIDDPQVLSKFRSQQSQNASPMTTSYMHQPISNNDAPPPPPRVPLRQPLLFRQGPSTNDNLPVNIQQIRVLEPQRRYEFLTSAGRRVQFTITNIDDYQGQSISDSDVRELTNAIDARIGFAKVAPPRTQPPPQPTFTQPKTWNPSVDLTQRGVSQRQRVGSDTQQASNDSQNMNFYHQAPNDLTRSASYGALNQGSYGSQIQQPSYNPATIDWNSYRQQNGQGQIDSSMIQQPIQVRQQNGGSFQTTAQFLPQQQQQQQPMMTRSMHSPPMNHNVPVYYQQASPYSQYQGQQYQQQQEPQQSVRYVTSINGYDLDQSRDVDANARI